MYSKLPRKAVCHIVMKCVQHVARALLPAQHTRLSSSLDDARLKEPGSKIQLLPEAPQPCTKLPPGVSGATEKLKATVPYTSAATAKYTLHYLL